MLFPALTSAVIFGKQYANQKNEIGSTVDLIPDAVFWRDDNVFSGLKNNVVHHSSMNKSVTWNELNYKVINTDLFKGTETTLIAEASSRNQKSDDKLENPSTNPNKIIKIENRQRKMNGLDRIIAAHSSRHSSSYYPDPYVFDPQAPFLENPHLNQNLKPDDVELVSDLDSNNFLSPDNLEEYTHFESSEILNGFENNEWTDSYEANFSENPVIASEPKSYCLF